MYKHEPEIPIQWQFVGLKTFIMQIKLLATLNNFKPKTEEGNKSWKVLSFRVCLQFSSKKCLHANGSLMSQFRSPLVCLVISADFECLHQVSKKRKSMLHFLDVQLRVCGTVRWESRQGRWSCSLLRGFLTFPQRSSSADRWCLSALPIWALWLNICSRCQRACGLFTLRWQWRSAAVHPLLKRSGEAARTSSRVRQGLFSKPELITRLLSGTRDGALSLSRLWLCNWRLWSQISRFEMWSTLPVCSPSPSISDRHEYTLLSTPTKFCSDKNPFSGQQRNAVCTCFKSYLARFLCISTAVKAGQTLMT